MAVRTRGEVMREALKRLVIRPVLVVEEERQAIVGR